MTGSGCYGSDALGGEQLSFLLLSSDGGQSRAQKWA